VPGGVMPPLVLLHGLNNSPAVFATVRAELDPGWPSTAPRLPIAEDVDAIAATLLPALPDRFLLCGFSFGGYIAMALFAAAPERIAGLALVGSGPWADAPESRPAREAAIAKAAAGGYAEMAAAGAVQALHPDNFGDETIHATRAAMIADYGSGAFVAHSRAAMNRPDRTALLAAATGPLLLAAGERDPLAPAERLMAVARIAPRAEVAIVPGAGHLLPLERPAALAAALTRWGNLAD